MEAGHELDRAGINERGQIQLSNPEIPNPSPLHKDHSIKSTLDERRHSTAIKLRKVLHIKKPSDDIQPASHPILANDSTTGQSKSRLDNGAQNHDKITVHDVLHHPIDTVKNRASAQGSHQTAANIATKEISHGQEVDLVEAQARVEQAQTQHEKVEAMEERDGLIKERQNTYVRWTVDRHVTQCRVLPRQDFVKKSKADFEYKTLENGTMVDWRAYGRHLLEYHAQQYGGQYIGHGMSHPAPSKETIMPNIERIIIASSPFQRFIMTTRKIYRWEDPAETSKYLVLYVTLLYFDLILPGVLSAIVYLVVSRRLTRDTLADVRTDLEQTEDPNQTAFTLTEFIEKQGEGSWVEKLQEEVGPWLMVQLCDLANMFEVLRNFYEWRVPSQTRATLSIFIVGILFTTFVPTWLLVKSMTVGMGFAFFGLFPLSSNFPEYRLLTSIPKRVFWNIPTHAEWAFKSLQEEGARYQQKNQVVVQAGIAVRPETDYGFYPGQFNHDKGRLVVGPASIRFETNIGHKVMWMLNYDQITKLEKIDRIQSKAIPGKGSGKDLRIASKLAEEQGWVLSDMSNRDEAFSQIVGFSKTSWQIVW